MLKITWGTFSTTRYDWKKQERSRSTPTPTALASKIWNFTRVRFWGTSCRFNKNCWTTETSLCKIMRWTASELKCKGSDLQTSLVRGRSTISSSRRLAWVRMSRWHRVTIDLILACVEGWARSKTSISLRWSTITECKSSSSSEIPVSGWNFKARVRRAYIHWISHFPDHVTALAPWTLSRRFLAPICRVQFRNNKALLSWWSRLHEARVVADRILCTFVRVFSPSQTRCNRSRCRNWVQICRRTSLWLLINLSTYRGRLLMKPKEFSALNRISSAPKMTPDRDFEKEMKARIIKYWRITEL